MSAQCWCGERAEFVIPASGASARQFVCAQHVRDGFEAIVRQQCEWRESSGERCPSEATRRAFISVMRRPLRGAATSLLCDEHASFLTRPDVTRSALRVQRVERIEQ